MDRKLSYHTHKMDVSCFPIICGGTWLIRILTFLMTAWLGDGTSLDAERGSFSPGFLFGDVAAAPVAVVLWVNSNVNAQPGHNQAACMLPHSLIHI
jgi:hypothetical protein